MRLRAPFEQGVSSRVPPLLLALALLWASPLPALAQGGGDCGCDDWEQWIGVCGLFGSCEACGDAGELICGPGQDCMLWHQGIAGFCTRCGDTGQVICAAQIPSCMPWHNPLLGFCAACGDTDQTICLSGPACMPFHDDVGLCFECGGASQIPCLIYPDSCEPGLVVAAGFCTACGASGGLACLDDPQPCNAPQPNDAVLRVCTPCGGHGQITCEYSGVPRCDAGLDLINLDPIRDLIADLVLAQVDVPQFLLDLIGLDPQDIIDTVDFCFDLDPVDFARDLQVSWPAAETPPGPRTVIFVHGQNGGGWALANAPLDEVRELRFGPRNTEAYQLDYNASFTIDPSTGSSYPIRLLGLDDSGAPYVAYSGGPPVTEANFDIRDVSEFLHAALLHVPVRGKPLFVAYSMGGFPVRDLLHQGYDDLRFRGLAPAQVIYVGHPHLGQVVPSREAVAITCGEIYTLDTSGEVDVDPGTNTQNCALNRWLEGWNQAAAARIDNVERPYVRFDNSYGTGDGQRPIPFAEEVSGVDVSTLTGDGTVDAQSARGLVFYNAYFVEQLGFDANTDCASCNNHSSAALLAALLAANPDTYTDVAVCADTFEDAVVDELDLAALRNHLTGAAPFAGPALERCDAGGGPECDLADVVRVMRALAVVPLPPGISPDCPAAIDLTDRLSLYWPFDSAEVGPFTNNAAPSCSVRFDGRREGNASFAAGAVGAAAIALDGAGDFVSIREFETGALAALDAYTRLGISLWVRPTSLPGPHSVLLDKAGEYQLALRNDGVLLVTLTPGSGGAVTLDTGQALPVGLQSHVALSYDGHAGGVRVFVDGALVLDAPFAPVLGDALPSAGTLRAGRGVTGADFAGRIDEVAIWDRALRDDEIALLYGGGAGLSLDPGGAGLVACTHLPTAQVQFVQNEAAWASLVGGSILFDTTAANLALSNELVSPPGGNAQMGPVLTFQSVPGMCRDWQLRALQPGAHLVFEDQEWTANPLANSIGIGDIDNHENDDWRVTWLGGAPMYAFGTWVIDNGSNQGEWLRVFDPTGQLMGSLDTTPLTGGETQSFVGVISNLPIGSIEFDEDAGGDDLAIRHFRFGVDANQDTIPDCNE